MQRVGYITNSSRYSGVGNRAYHVRNYLHTLYSDLEATKCLLDGTSGTLHIADEVRHTLASWSSLLGNKSVNWVRLGRVLTRMVRSGEATYDVYHLTNQTLSFLAKRLSPSVVTVHDIIELTDPQDRMSYLLNRYLYSGISEADRVIAVSEYTKQRVIEVLDIPSDRIRVITNGVSDAFYPIEMFEQTVAYRQLLQDLRIDEKTRVVLYVGSDHARKNVTTAVRAFTHLLTSNPHAVFVKVGAAGISSGREALLEEVESLGVRDRVRFIEHVSDEELNAYYNLADVFIFPSLHEGFGLPVLEAMAAGTPVVCSNASSLPEVSGDAALSYDPRDIDGFSEGLTRILDDTAMCEDLRTRGLERASLFAWQGRVRAVKDVYDELI